MKTKLASWPAPKNISALCTTRVSGFSQAPFDSFNLAQHVGDNETNVARNRQLLQEQLNIPAEPVWLNQTHSIHCVIPENDANRDADAAITQSRLHPLAILTADCLPITLCSKQGTEIAAIHAGWRGLFNGIVENTVSKMTSSSKDLMAWIGPAICQNCYEIGVEVYDSFTGKYPQSQSAFIPRNGKWLANLPQIAELVLNSQGIHAVYQSGLCTYESENELYSYRKQAITGRIATLIWFND